MVTDREIIAAVKPGLEGFSRQFIAELEKQVAQIFEKDIVRAVEEQYIKEYDKLAKIVEGRTPGRIRGKDPLSLVDQRELFIEHLRKELASSSFAGGAFNLNVVLGVRDSGNDQPSAPVSLLYYLTGTPDNHGFITKEHKRRKTPFFRGSLGRLGEGFMISESSYIRERWEEQTGIPFAEIKHPISGLPPYTGFDDVPSRIDYGFFLQRALERVLSKFDNKKV
jgi:hypothetical protein